MGDMLDYLGETGPRIEICRLIVQRFSVKLGTVRHPLLFISIRPRSRECLLN